MGLLNKWGKKKEQDQLEAVEKKTDTVEVTKKDTTKTEVKKTASAKKQDKNGVAYRVLISPLVSEKATTQEMHGKYVFIVERDATKEDIKHAVEEIYGVRPTRVHTMQFEGKRVRFGYVHGKRSDWKKAVVEVAKGHTIHIHEGV